MLVLELCTMRQSTGNSILHIVRHYVNFKIAIKCVNICKDYDGKLIVNFRSKFTNILHWITKGKNIARKNVFALFTN
jgi:hypothetical protein